MRMSKVEEWLQWGRDRQVADSWGTRGAFVQFYMGFNGAATVRSRIDPRHSQRQQAHDASMGPRPSGRG